VVRLLLFLLGTVSFSRPTQPPAAGRQSGDLAEEEYPAVADRPGHSADPGYHGGAGALSGQGAGGGSEAPGGPGRRRRVPRRLKWGVAVAVLVLIFRRAIAATALMTLSAAAHLIGFDVHLPSIRFAWPWQTVGAGATTNVELGPWVLQKRSMRSAMHPPRLISIRARHGGLRPQVTTGFRFSAGRSRARPVM
jgi:hypothetical protein